MKLKTENLKRARRIRIAILKPHLDGIDNIICALSDLRHLCDRYNLDFGKLDKAAYRNYINEK